MNAAALNLEGWLPIGFGWHQGQPRIDWRLFGRERLTEPFFEDSVRRVTVRPFNQAFRRETGAGELEAWAAQSPGIAPSGFIFHMSRCGSTLVAQMLAARSDSVVVSEAPPIDALLNGDAPEADRLRWLRALISALGQPRLGREQHLFIKFDCWHIGQLPFIRRAFPDTPWLFLYREPCAVLASHLRQRGAHTVPGLVDPRHFGMSLPEALALPPAAYCARVLAAMCGAASDHAARGQGALINYADLPDALFQTILPHFSVPTTPDQRTVMAAVAQRHSKRPDQTFTRALDAPALDAEAEAVAALFLDPLYAKLESQRIATPINESAPR